MEKGGVENMCDLRTSGIRSQTQVKEHQIKKIEKREKGQTGVEWGGGGGVTSIANFKALMMFT